MADRYDLRINQGESFSLNIPVLTEQGAPADLTGVVVRAQVRRNPGTPVLHEWSTAIGNATLGPGQIVLSVPAAISSTWTWRRASWDLELVDGPTTTRLLEGSITVTPEITR